jgi:hypothetical protein
MIINLTYTIVWHVNYTNIFYNPEVVSGIIDELGKVFGIESPLSFNRGKDMITLEPALILAMLVKSF